MIIRSVYLAGPMTGRPWRDVILERKKAIRLLTRVGIKVLDPARSKSLGDEEILDPHGNATMPPGALVERDLTDVETTDATIVLDTDPISFGTTFEWSHARAHGKPVFVISKTPPEDLGAWRTHGRNVTEIFPDIEELVDHLAAYWR